VWCCVSRRREICFYTTFEVRVARFDIFDEVRFINLPKEIQRMFCFHVNKEIIYLSIYLPDWLSIYLSIYPSIYLQYLWLYSHLLDLGRFSRFLIFYRVGRTPWTEDQPFARPLPEHIGQPQTHNKRIQTSMPRVGFEPMIPVFERAKTVHALDNAATVIGRRNYIYTQILWTKNIYICQNEYFSKKICHMSFGGKTDIRQFWSRMSFYLII
jgi:hypothetical protein